MDDVTYDTPNALDALKQTAEERRKRDAEQCLKAIRTIDKEIRKAIEWGSTSVKLTSYFHFPGYRCNYGESENLLQEHLDALRQKGYRVNHQIDSFFSARMITIEWGPEPPSFFSVVKAFWKRHTGGH